MSLKNKIIRALALRWLRNKLKNKESGMAKVLKALDGWKLMIGVAIVFGAKVYDQLANGHAWDIVGAVLSVLGWLPPAEWTGPGMTAAVGGAIALVGFVARLWKAQQQLRAGATASQLLSDEGHVKKYIADVDKGTKAVEDLPGK